MNLVRFEPWSLFDELQRDPGPSVMRGDRHQNGTRADWVPAVDVVEHKDRFVVRADLPGVDSADIHVSMEDGMLAIAGERHAEERSEIDGLQRYERSVGRFIRRFSLPDHADNDSISARSSHGILEVTIPKRPEVQPRRITVDAA